MSSRIIPKKGDPLAGASDRGYNGIFHLQLPTGPTYREIVFELKDILPSQIKRIALELNGDTFIDVTGKDLQMLRISTGQHSTDKVLVLPFTDTTQSSLESQNFSELVTLPNENLNIRVETDAPLADGSQDGKVASVKMRYKFAPSRMQNGKRARVKLPRIYTMGMAGSASGDVRYNNFANQNKSGNPSRIQRIYINTPHCDNLTLKQDNIEIFDKSLDQNNYDLRSNNQHPIDGVYLLDSVQEGWAATDAISAVGSFEFIAHLTDAGDFTALFQTVEIYTRPVTV